MAFEWSQYMETLAVNPESTVAPPWPPFIDPRSLFPPMNVTPEGATTSGDVPASASQPTSIEVCTSEATTHIEATAATTATMTMPGDPYCATSHGDTTSSGKPVMKMDAGNSASSNASTSTSIYPLTPPGIVIDEEVRLAYVRRRQIERERPPASKEASCLTHDMESAEAMERMAADVIRFLGLG